MGAAADYPSRRNSLFNPNPHRLEYLPSHSCCLQVFELQSCRDDGNRNGFRMELTFFTTSRIEITRAWLSGIGLTLFATAGFEYAQILAYAWFFIHVFTLNRSKSVWKTAFLGTFGTLYVVLAMYLSFAPELHFLIALMFALGSACIMPTALVCVLIYRRLRK